jgi:hypothetical protein
MQSTFLPYKTLPNGNLLFPSWEEAIHFIDKNIRTDFRAKRNEDGTTEVEIWKPQTPS